MLAIIFITCNVVFLHDASPICKNNKYAELL